MKTEKIPRGSQYLPSPEVLATEDHMINMWMDSRKVKIPADRKAVIEVWACFKQFLLEKLNQDGMKRFTMRDFCTFQRLMPDRAKHTNFLLDKPSLAYLLEWNSHGFENIRKLEKQYDEIYGGMTKEEIQEYANTY